MARSRLFFGQTTTAAPPSLLPYEDEVLADNPVFLVPFAEASGNVIDLIAAKVGTPGGTPTYGITGPVAGKTAMSFASSADYVSFADHAPPGGATGDLDVGDTGFTLEVWVKHAFVNDALKVIVNKRNNSFAMTINETEKFAVGKAGVEGFFRSTNNIPDNAWTHLVWTRTSSGIANNAMYIDGVAETLTTGAGDQPNNSLADNASVVEFAREGAAIPLLGGLAYFAIYKTVLSSTRVARHYAARSVVAGTDEGFPYIGGGYYP